VADSLVESYPTRRDCDRRDTHPTLDLKLTRQNDTEKGKNRLLTRTAQNRGRVFEGV